MKCERCGCETDPSSYEMLDYCAFCSRNLCDGCMAAGTCPDSPGGKHTAYRDNPAPDPEKE